MADQDTKKNLGTQGAEDTVAGKTKEAAGKVQKNVGKALGDKEMEAKGKARELGGKAQSKGGKVEMSLEKTFWGALFGMFTDKYGIDWMINCQLEG